VEFSPDGSTLGSGSNDKTVILWDVATRREKARLLGHQDRISSLAFSPDGGTLATASADQSVILWDLTNNRPRVTLRDHRSKLSAVTFGPKGDTLAAGGHDGRIMIWDVATGAVRTTIEGRKGPIWELVFTPDGATVAAGVLQTTVITWDVSLGQIKKTQKAWHNNETTSAASRPGNNLLALARGRDGTIWLNDINFRRTLGYLKGHHGSVRSMALGPGATLLASGGHDKLVRIWNLRDELDRWSRIEKLIDERIESERRAEAERRRKQKERRDDDKEK
jgi:WD40 repeat protein